MPAEYGRHGCIGLLPILKSVKLMPDKSKTKPKRPPTGRGTSTPGATALDLVRLKLGEGAGEDEVNALLSSGKGLWRRTKTEALLNGTIRFNISMLLRFADVTGVIPDGTISDFCKRSDRHNAVRCLFELLRTSPALPDDLHPGPWIREQLAHQEKIEITDSGIDMWLRGSNLPPQKMIHHLERILGHQEGTYGRISKRLGPDPVTAKQSSFPDRLRKAAGFKPGRPGHQAMMKFIMHNAGVSAPVARAIANGNRKLSFKTAIGIARAISAAPEWLFDHIEVPRAPISDKILATRRGLLDAFATRKIAGDMDPAEWLLTVLADKLPKSRRTMQFVSRIIDGSKELTPRQAAAVSDIVGAEYLVLRPPLRIGRPPKTAEERALSKPSTNVYAPWLKQAGAGAGGARTVRVGVPDAPETAARVFQVLKDVSPADGTPEAVARDFAGVLAKWSRMPWKPVMILEWLEGGHLHPIEAGIICAMTGLGRFQLLGQGVDTDGDFTKARIGTSVEILRSRPPQ